MKNNIQVNPICDSISQEGVRLTTFLCRIPYFILAQLNTHRLFCRNAASMRAIPTNKLIEQVRNDPYIPTTFGKNQRGMHAVEAISEQDSHEARIVWECAARDACYHAEKLARIGSHKQDVNRLLSPYVWIDWLVTATEWDNFLNVRLAGDVQESTREVAKGIEKGLQTSTPTRLEIGDWHVPFGANIPEHYSNDTRIQIAVARCARLSYMRHDGTQSVDEDLFLYNRLVNDQHLSPLEHVATPSLHSLLSPPLRGWTNYRTIVGARRTVQVGRQNIGAELTRSRRLMRRL